MSRQTWGIWLILFAVLALWLYNTGRAQAVLAVIKDPANLQVVQGGTTGSGGTGGQSSNPITSMIQGVFNSLIPGLGGIAGQVGGILGGIFGGGQ